MMERREQTNIEKKNKQMLQNNSSFLIHIKCKKSKDEKILQSRLLVPKKWWEREKENKRYFFNPN